MDWWITHRPTFICSFNNKVVSGIYCFYLITYFKWLLQRWSSWLTPNNLFKLLGSARRRHYFFLYFLWFAQPWSIFRFIFFFFITLTHETLDSFLFFWLLCSWRRFLLFLVDKLTPILGLNFWTTHHFGRSYRRRLHFLLLLKYLLMSPVFNSISR